MRETRNEAMRAPHGCGKRVVVVCISLTPTRAKSKQLGFLLATTLDLLSTWFRCSSTLVLPEDLPCRVPGSICLPMAWLDLLFWVLPSDRQGLMRTVRDLHTPDFRTRTFVALVFFSGPMVADAER